MGFTMHRSLLGIVLVVGAAVGCAALNLPSPTGSEDAVRARASFDFRCSREEVTVVDGGGRCSYIARGCGSEAFYIVRPLSPEETGTCCSVSGCDAQLNSEVREAPSSETPDGAPPALPCATHQDCPTGMFCSPLSHTCQQQR
jgi:hypothetical protein